MPNESTPRTKRPSGAELRRRRVAKGLPRLTPAQLASKHAADKRYREAHSEAIRERKRRYPNGPRPGAIALRAEVAALKVARGCTDCGYNAHPDALHFDHLPAFTKDRNIARLIDHRNRERLYAEIGKCEVVCANCHAIRTATRRRAVEAQ